MNRPMSDTLTLELMGEVTLDDLAIAMVEFKAVVQALTAELRGDADPPQWIIEDLHSGSALAVIRGRGSAPTVDAVVRAYEEVGEALETHRPVPHGPRVQTAARRLARLATGRIPAIRFETPNRDYFVAGVRPEPRPRLEVSPPPAEPPPALLALPTPSKPEPTPSERHQVAVVAPLHVVEAWGAVEGRLQTLTNRDGLRFTLFDTLHDRAVSCYLDPNFPQDEMREKWGRRARVEGWVKREAASGRPINVRRVCRIDILPELGTFDFRSVRGVLPFDPKRRAEDTIRGLRDA